MLILANNLKGIKEIMFNKLSLQAKQKFSKVLTNNNWQKGEGDRAHGTQMMPTPHPTFV